MKNEVKKCTVGKKNNIESFDTEKFSYTAYTQLFKSTWENIKSPSNLVD